MLAILLPPIAAVLIGKPWQGLLCVLLMLTLVGWIPASIWACLIVGSHDGERRHQEILAALRG